MSSPLPPNMALTTVRGRYGAWSTDTVPVFQPWVGMKVTFTPAYPFVTNTTSTPSPTVIATTPRTFQTDASGYLSDISAGFDGSGNGVNRNCQIVSSDDPDINPSDWKYLVTFLGPGATHFRPFRTPAPSGATVDMAILTPQRVAAGSTPTAAEIAAANAAASAASAEATVASIHRGQPGGVAALDADGDVNDADGNKILGGGSGGGGGTLATISDMSVNARAFNAALTSGHATTLAEMRAVIGAGTGNGSSNVVIGTSSGQAADAAITNTAIGLRALNTAVLHTTGDETKAGILTLSSPPVIPPAIGATNAAQLAQVTAAVTGLFPTAQSNVTGLTTALAARPAADGTGASGAVPLFLAATTDVEARDAIGAMSATDALSSDAFATALSDALSGYVTTASLTTTMANVPYFLPYNGTAWPGARPVDAGTRVLVALGGPAAPVFLNTSLHDIWLGTIA